MSAAPQPAQQPYKGEIYPGPRPFSRQEKEVFFGRPRETADVTTLLQAYTVVVLHSASGAGKSSLVNAGIVPSLGSERCLITRVCGVDAPEGANPFIANVLASACAPSNAADLAALSRCDGQAWYLILDQFEELFTTCPELWPHREPFFRSLGGLLKADPDARILIVVREEWVAYLDRYSRFFDDRLAIRYRLDLLRRDEAVEAVKKPARLSGDERLIAWAEENAGTLVGNLLRIPIRTSEGEKDIEGEFADPFHLQVVCRNVLDRVTTGRRSTPDDLRRLTDVDEALRVFYNSALARAAGRFWRERRLRNWFDRKLITPARTRGLVYMDEASGRTGGVPNSEVERLEQKHLVHREVRSGASWFEIAHDRLVRPIQRSNAEFRRRFRRRVAVFAAAGLAGIAAIAAPHIKSWVVRPDLLASETARQTPEERAQTLADLSLRRWRASDRQQARALFYAARQTHATAAVNFLAANTSRPESARMLVDFAISQWNPSDKGEGLTVLEYARQSDAWETLQVLDRRAENDARARNARAEFMKSLRSYVNSRNPDPQVMAYACSHATVVVGASEPVDTATAELARMRRLFPEAELGQVYQYRNRNYQQIYAGLFLTCEEAVALMSRVQQAFKTDPFVGNWYDPECGFCAGLPRVNTGGRPSLLTTEVVVQKQSATSRSLSGGGRLLAVQLRAPDVISNVSFQCEGAACRSVYECPDNGKCGPQAETRLRIDGKTATWYGWTSSTEPAIFRFMVYYRPPG